MSRKVGQKVLLIHVELLFTVASSGVDTTGSWAIPAFISMHLSDLQNQSPGLSSTQDLHFLISGPPSSLRGCIFFLFTLLAPTLFFFFFSPENQASGFAPSLKSMCRHTVCDQPFNWWVCLMFLY